MQKDAGLNELQVVVERRGYGAQAWAWRLSTGMIDMATSTVGFVCAEDAYAAGRLQLLAMRGDTPPLLSSIGTLMRKSMKAKVLPVVRKPGLRRQHVIPAGW